MNAPDRSADRTEHTFETRTQSMIEGGLYMPEKRRCRVCGAELSATANVCPKCGAKQSRPLLAFLMVVAAIIIVIVC